MISRREVTCMKSVGTILIVAILTIVPLSGCLYEDHTFFSKKTLEENVAIDHLFVEKNDISARSDQVNNWSIQVVDTIGKHPSIALDSNDLPHILYCNDSGNELIYARYDGNEWQREIVESGNHYDNTTSLVLDSNDHPHIAYVAWAVGGGSAHDLKYAYHDGNAWNITYLESMVDFMSLALDSQERPHISCSTSDPPNHRLIHISWDGNQWHNETVEQDGWVLENSIAIDSNDRIHISYKKFITGGSGHLKYAYFNGESWKNETLDDQGDAGSYNSIALNSIDLPHIAYCNSQVQNYRLLFTSFDGISWNKEIVDSEGMVGLYSSLVIDSEDRPHISYIENGPNYALRYAFWNGVAWQNETVDSEGYISYSSIALSPSGQKHICYKSSSGGLKYAWSNRVINWSIQVVDTIGTHSSIVLDSNNLPHILYCNDSGNELIYARYDGNEWQREIVESGNHYDNTTSLVLDSNDHPHIAYVAWAVGGGSAHDLKYAYHDGNAWNITYLESMVDFMSLALDSQERPHISCSTSDPPNHRLIHISWDGNQWHNETVEQDGWVLENSIAIDSNDRIHISYKKFITGGSGHLKYAYFNGESWKNETLDDQGDAGSYNSIALNSIDLPHIAYCNSQVQNYRLLFTSFDGISWNKEIVDSEGMVGLYSSLVIDSEDRPHISYIENGPNYALRYAFWNGVAWQNETVDSEGFMKYSSLALSPSGQKHISYTSSSGGLKYAYSNITISDDEPPISSVEVISPYRWESIPFNINVTAEDNISKVIKVELWYRFSDDNSSWGEWELLGFDGTSPWSFVFTAPYGSGHYRFSQKVYDTEGNPSSIPMLQSPRCGYDPVAPLAEAGENVTIREGDAVLFNGSGSHDNVGIGNYTWHISYGGVVRILWGITAQFQFDVPGNYTVSLVVTDNAGLADTDNVTVTVHTYDPPGSEPPDDEKDTDGDGWNDTTEQECGTDPYDNTSYPEDLDDDGTPDKLDPDIDGDGVPNEKDAYPRDSLRWKEEDSTLVIILLILGASFILIAAGTITYSRIKRRDILDNDTREAVYNYITNNPGSHAEKIRKHLGIGDGTLRHHLRQLKLKGMVRFGREGRYKFFYPSGFGEIQSLTPIQREIIDILEHNESITAGEIAKKLGKDRTTVLYHIDNLVDKGLLRSKKVNQRVYWYIEKNVENQ